MPGQPPLNTPPPQRLPSLLLSAALPPTSVRSQTPLPLGLEKVSESTLRTGGKSVGRAVSQNAHTSVSTQNSRLANEEFRDWRYVFVFGLLCDVM